MRSFGDGREAQAEVASDLQRYVPGPSGCLRGVAGHCESKRAQSEPCGQQARRCQLHPLNRLSHEPDRFRGPLSTAGHAITVVDMFFDQSIVVGQGRRRHPAHAGQIPGTTPPTGQAIQESQRAPGDRR